jgi:hypothetical protein
MSKVVSIKTHPKYRDIAALRKFLVEGQEDFGTKVDMDRFIASDDPEIQHQLSELNEWAKALVIMSDGPRIDMEPHLVKNFNPLPGVDFSHYQIGRSEGKSRPICEIIPSFLSPYFTGGLKKGDFYNHAVIPPTPWDRTPLHHMSRNQDTIRVTLDNSYKVRKSDDANPST